MSVMADTQKTGLCFICCLILSPNPHLFAHRHAICLHPNAGTQTVKLGLAQMLKGGVIMDVVNPEQAKIAEV